MPEMIIPIITNRKVRLLARPCGTPTGIACAIGETIGFIIGFTNESLRKVLDLRGIGARAGVRAGTALMLPPQFFGQLASELRLHVSFLLSRHHLLIRSHELIAGAKVCLTQEQTAFQLES